MCALDFPLNFVFAPDYKLFGSNSEIISCSKFRNIFSASTKVTTGSSDKLIYGWKNIRKKINPLVPYSTFLSTVPVRKCPHFHK